MESECSPPSTSLVKYCDCDCNCSSLVMNRSISGTCLRSVKRKYDAFEENRFIVPGLEVPQNARVEIGNECVALRETVGSQQQTIQNLIFELEEERNASSSAANEAMSMILRLQRDKAEIQMEAKQFKRFAEEKMAHDQLETLALEDLLYKREEVIEALTYELQAYKHRMMCYGLTEGEANEFMGMVRHSGLIENVEGEFPPGVYPRLKCNSNESQAYSDCEDETLDIEKFAVGKMPHTGDQLKDLEGRISQMEKSPISIQSDDGLIGITNVLNKVIVDEPPGASGHLRNFSSDNLDSLSAMAVEIAEVEDDLGDRICIIDSGGVGGGGCMEIPKESFHSHGKDLEIQKLYARLHALEADRESMRHAIISFGTEKAKMVLLKEIAQSISKEMSPTRRMPVRKQLVVGIFSFMSLFKWIIHLIFWRKKTHRCKFMFGLSSNNVGLLLLLDLDHHHVGERNCIFSTDTFRLL